MRARSCIKLLLDKSHNLRRGGGVVVVGGGDPDGRKGNAGI